MTTTLTQRIAIAALILVSGLALSRLWSIGQSVPGIDYYQFWAVGEAIEHDQVSNPYADEERKRIGTLYLERARANAPDPTTTQGHTTRFATAAGARPVLETYSTPFLYTAIHWFSSGDYETDFTRWRILSLLAFVFGVVGIARAIAITWVPCLSLLAGLLLFFAPLQSETQVQNVNSVQLGLLAMVLVLLRKEGNTAAQVAAGAVLGTAAMFKPNVALIAVLLVAGLLFSRKMREFALLSCGIAGGAVFAFASSSAFFGSATSWVYWLETIRLIPPEIITVQMGNYAPAMFAFGEGALGLSAVLTLAFALPVFAALWIRRDDAPMADDRALPNAATLMGVGCVIFLLSANLVWQHYFMLTVPLLLTTLGRGFGASSQSAGERLLDRTLPALALVGLLATPTFKISNLPHEIYFPLALGGGAVILYGLALRQLFESREDTSK